MESTRQVRQRARGAGLGARGRKHERTGEGSSNEDVRGLRGRRGGGSSQGRGAVREGAETAAAAQGRGGGRPAAGQRVQAAALQGTSFGAAPVFPDDDEHDLFARGEP